MTMHFCFLQKGMIWYGSVKSWGGGGGVIGVPR